MGRHLTRRKGSGIRYQVSEGASCGPDHWFL